MKRVWLLAAVGACALDEHSIEQASTQQCAQAVVEGVDVYAGQGTIDWGMVASSGRGFAFIKATQGDYNKQSTFAANWANAKTAGVLRSAYHFFDPTIDGVAQANWFLAEIAAAGGMGPGDLPAMLDIECPISSSQATSQSSGPNCEYTGDSGWVATATMQQRIFDWLDTVEAATGQKAFIYSYPSWFGDVKFTDTHLTDYPLYIATYGSCASVPAPWTSSVFWQYSASATVPGISGNVDVDRFFGSAADLQTWVIPTTPPPPPPVDAGVSPDAPGAAPQAAGCGCRTGSDTAPPLAAIAMVLALRRRSTRRNRATAPRGN
jgi:lysozyme